MPKQKIGQVVLTLMLILCTPSVMFVQPQNLTLFSGILFTVLFPKSLPSMKHCHAGSGPSIVIQRCVNLGSNS